MQPICVSTLMTILIYLISYPVSGYRLSQRFDKRAPTLNLDYNEKFCISVCDPLSDETKCNMNEYCQYGAVAICGRKVCVRGPDEKCGEISYHGNTNTRGVCHDDLICSDCGFCKGCPVKNYGFGMECSQHECHNMNNPLRMPWV